MSDPKHLTDVGADATDLERELLLAAQGVGLSPAEKKVVWANVALQALPAARAASATPGSAAPAGTSKALAGLAPWLKGLLLICGLGGISAGIFRLQQAERANAASRQVEPARAVEAPTLAASAVAPHESPTAPTETTRTQAVEAVTAPNASRDASPAASPSGLRDESLAVLRIRSALRSGDVSYALRLLDQARQRFPHGALVQEREALSIEALAKSGARDAAARQAEAFLRAHPKSPYAADVQTFKSN